MMKKLVCLIWGVFAACTAATAQGQGGSWSVSGSVTDQTGSMLPGVAVQEKGTTNGVATDRDGAFAISCAPDATLIFSYLGFTSQEVRVNGRSLLQVQMQEDSHVIDEVMVVAYGTAKKSSFTGSASLVRSDAIKDLPSTSFENALNGKIAGLQLTATSGQAGSAPSIRIRGIGSMNASNEPLYVVDGVPVNAGNTGQMSDYTYSTNNVMNTLNPSDIESISVLKDAAASSLYGSRAANGVILITTKRGKEGKPAVNFKASVGFTPSWATRNYEAAGTQEQVNMLYMVFHDYNTSRDKSAADANADALRRLNEKFNRHGYAFSTTGTGLFENVNITDYDNSGRAGSYFDWEDAYFRTAVYQTYDVSVSGATPIINHYTSLSYTEDEGRLKMNRFDRISGRVNLSQKVGKTAEFATNVNFAKTHTSGYNDTRSTGSNYYYQTRNMSWGLYWPTDYKTGEDWTERYGSYSYNGLYYDKEWDNKSTNTKLSAMETLTLHLFQGLDVKSILSYDHTLVKDHIYYSKNHFNGTAYNGRVHEIRTIYEKIVSSTTANYNVNLNENRLGLLVGFEAERNTTDFTRATGQNLPSKVYTVATAGTLDANAYKWGDSMVSVLSKVDYDYNERYFASGSYRRDGSSRLSPDTRWGNFWSVAGAWNISREGFLRNHPVISDLKLRVSYGVNGTLPSSYYGYMNLVSYTNAYSGQPGGIITSLADEKLSWETNYTTNIGLDFGLFNHRLRGSIEYFNRDSKDLLQSLPISSVTGFSSILKNIGSINNKGIEIELSGDVLRRKDFLWTAAVNATHIRSKVTKLYDGEDIIWYDPTGGDARAQYIYREGQSTLAFYGYEWAGVDQTNGKGVYYVNNPDDPTDGDFIFNGRGATYQYGKANYVIIGNGIPRLYGGFNTQLSYKGIDLGINFIYKIGGKLYDGAYKDVADDGYYWERIRAKSYYKNMWSEQNPNGSLPKLSGNDPEDAMQYSSRCCTVPVSCDSKISLWDIHCRKYGHEKP
ncbi:MAG: SusC/RagA family TonB-linked outer membrane protein [Bacteroides sp.]|nr:SusC/RagA family TonB-linked outer membrane protein [Bacteroides sp.]